MIIHVVKPGDNLYSIGRQYGVPYTQITADNEINPATSLVIGQTLVILEGTKTHTVAQGESLFSIAKKFGVSISDILTSNPGISGNTVLSAGRTLRIPPKEKKLGILEVNGYSFPSINTEVLRKTLPYLTYLSIFSNEVNPDGTIRVLDDAMLIQAARETDVAPLMVITNLVEGGGFSSEVAHSILTNEQNQERLINNALQTLRSRNYYGLDIDFEYIFPEDRENYNNFLRKVTSRLRPQGYSVTTALAPKSAPEQKGLLYEAHDYPVHGALTNHVILMTYEWGFTSGPPMAVAPLNEVRKVISYAVTAIPRQKILMGIPNYGYDWTLPYKAGTKARTLSNTGAVNLAAGVGTVIKYDQKSQTPFFNYYDAERRQHVVWFEDARSINAKLKLVDEFNLGGVSYWTIGRYFPQNWLILRSLFDIKKVI